jgi:soluble lytic murein transglycosylase-like protein
MAGTRPTLFFFSGLAVFIFFLIIVYENSIRGRSVILMPIVLAAKNAAGLSLPNSIVFAIPYWESGWQPSTENGGLFQVELTTAQGYGYTGDQDGLLNPYTSAYYGCVLLHDLELRYNSIQDILSAYNSGSPFASAPESTTSNYVPGVLAIAENTYGYTEE